MTSIDHQQSAKLSPKASVAKYEEEKRQQLTQFDADNSEFMRPLAEPKHQQQKLVPKINKSVLLQQNEVEKSLREIFDYYAKSYDRPVKQYSSFNHLGSNRIIMQAYFLFCKNFHILRAIFSVERLTVIFRKHADYGKFLSFDNFYFLINSMSHEPEAKKFFRLEQMTQNLNIQTAEQLQKQEFYNYLQLGSPQKYRQNFSELFKAFNLNEKPRNEQTKFHYRKFSLPQLRKRAIPQPKDKKKNQKDLFILKHDKNPHHNHFDEAKSIVVSWDSLRAKSSSNLQKSEQIVERKYLRMDPEDDPYLKEIRPATRSPKGRDNRNSKIQRMLKGKNNSIQQKIKEIEKSQNIKNQKILDRIDKKLNVKSGRKLQI